MFNKTQFMIIMVFCLIISFTLSAYSIEYTAPEKSEILEVIELTKRFYLNTGQEHRLLREYLGSSSGFSVGYFKEYKDDIKKGVSFVITLNKDEFFLLLDKFETDFKEILDEKYDEIATRLQEQSTTSYLILHSPFIMALIAIVGGILMFARQANAEAGGGGDFGI